MTHLKNGQKKTMMIYHQAILLICMVILGWLAYLTFSGPSNNFEENIDEEIQEKLMGELIVDLLKADHDRNNSSYYERNRRNLDAYVRTQTLQGDVDIRIRLNNAERSLMLPQKQRKDQEIFHKNKFNALEKIAPAPMAVALLAQIVLVSAQYKTDFELECPRTGCKHLEYPGSFKATLLQMSFSAYDAFNKAHVNMDEISMLTRMIPTEIGNAVRTLIQGSPEEIQLLLPDTIMNIKYIAQSARMRANETVQQFDHVKLVLEEIIAGGTSTKKLSIEEVDRLNVRIKTEKAWEEHYKTQKKNTEDDKKALKKALTESKKEFDKAMDNLPSGWSVIGMTLVEGLAKAAGNLVEGLGSVAVNVASGFAATLEPLSLIGKGVDTFKGFANMLKPNPDSKNANQPSRISNAVQNLEIPRCNKKVSGNANGQTKITAPRKDQNVSRHNAAEFLTALTDLVRVENILEQFNTNIFVAKKSGNQSTLRLKNDAEEQIDFLKSSIVGPQKRVNSMPLPPSFAGDFVLFYKNIVDLADKMKKNTEEGDVKDLQKQAQELLDSSRCFKTWAQQTLQMPPMEKPTPFSNPKSGTPGSKTAAQIHAETAQLKVDTYTHELENAQNRYEKKAAQLLVTNNKLREAINKLTEFNASKATLEEVISILQDALITLNELRTKWLEILEFFQQIESIIDVSLGNSLDKFARLIGTGAKFEKVSNLLKAQIYQYIQEAMTNGHLINRMSEVYVAISTEYIMPPVRELGIMLESKDAAKIQSMKIKVSRQAKNANQAITAKIKEERAAFVQSVGARMTEIETTFKPILTCIAPERRNELSVIVQQGSTIMPKVDENMWV